MTGAEESDADLLAAHVAGDRQAFETLIHRHRDRLWAVACRTLWDREEAADALQDALLSAHRRAAGFRGDAAVTTWLHRIVVNACLDRLRRRRARPTTTWPDHDIPDPHDAHDRTAVHLDVRAALSTLPDHQRVALTLVDMHGLSISEAAAVLDVAEGTVKSRCSRGRSALLPLLRPSSSLSGAGAQSHPRPAADRGNHERAGDVPVPRAGSELDGGRP
ncbi:MAG: RNA polymerase sigma factor SigM [Angustibacter sp.]